MSSIHSRGAGGWGRDGHSSLLGCFGRDIQGQSSGLRSRRAAFIKFLQSEGIHTWWQQKLLGAKEKIYFLHEELLTLFGLTGPGSRNWGGCRLLS